MKERFQLPKLPLWKRLLPSRMGNGVDWYMPHWWCCIFGGSYPYGWHPGLLGTLKRKWEERSARKNNKHEP